MNAAPILLRFAERPRARARLLCFAHAGGSASVYAMWSRLLPETIEVVGVQLPGREARRLETPPSNVPQVVSEVVAASPSLLDRPLALFGHSLGALLAFEAARALQSRHPAGLARLFVSGARAPQRSRGEPISQLPDLQFIDVMTRRYDGIPKLILDEPELLRYFLPILRADLKLFESYRYTAGPALSCPIDAWGGMSDARVTATELEAWSAETTASFGCQLFPGGHFYLTSARDTLLRRIAAVLEAS